MRSRRTQGFADFLAHFVHALSDLLLKTIRWCRISLGMVASLMTSEQALLLHRFP
jgi:hypothetical protein